MRKNVVRNAVLVSLFAGMVVGNTYAFNDNIMTKGKATTDVSPVDKKASADSNGKIYDANSTRYNKQFGYFWTDLGHATIKDYDGNDVDLYTPFIYHTENNVWDTSATNYDPVHTGDGSEMKCQESMSDISVGEFDRIVKALYTNDVTVYNAINGGYDESGKKVDGLKQKLFTKIVSSTKDNVTAYRYLNAKGDVIGTTLDIDTKVVDNQIDFFSEKGEITSRITTSDGIVHEDTTGGIASRDYVDNAIANIDIPEATVDTNTYVSELNGIIANNGDLTLNIVNNDGTKVVGTISDVATQTEVRNNLIYTDMVFNQLNQKTIENANSITKLNETTDNHETRITNLENKVDNFKDTDTITKVERGDSFIEVTKESTGANETTYTLSINSSALHEFVDSVDKDTITTVEAGTGIEVVSGETETGINYTINLDENVVKEIAKTVDTNTIITNADTDRNSDKGTATITLTNSDGGKVDTTITDIASKKALDDYKSYNEFDKNLIKTVVTNDNRRINNLESRVDQLDTNTKEVGAHAAALAALHPLDFDEDEKLSFAAGYGNYRGKNAVALGAFYRPNEDTMINFGGTFGSGDGMINLGVSFKLGPTATNKKSKKQLIEEVDDLKAQVAELHEAVAALLAK